MAEITLRVPLGRPLTYQEVDDNFRSVQELTLLAQQFALTAQEASTLADEAKNEAIAAKDEALTASGSAASDAQRAEDAADRAEAIADFDGLHNTLAGRNEPGAHDAGAISYKLDAEGAVGLTLADKAEEVTSIWDFGAPKDGSEASSHLQAAIDDLHRSGGGTLHIPLAFSGVIKLSNQIHLKENVSIYIDDGVIVDCSDWSPTASRTALVVANGSFGQEIATTSNLNSGDTLINTVSPHDLAVGDWVLIKSQRACLHDDAGSNWRLGETTTNSTSPFFGEPVQVKSIKSPTEFEITAGLLFTSYRIDQSEETYEKSRDRTTIQKMNLMRGVELVGGRWRKGENIGSLIELALCKEPLVKINRACEMGKAAGVAVTLTHCLRGKVIASASRPADWSLQTDHAAYNAFKDISSWWCEYVLKDINGCQGWDGTFISGSVPSLFPKVKMHSINAKEDGSTSHGGSYGLDADIVAENPAYCAFRNRARFSNIKVNTTMPSSNNSGVGVIASGWGCLDSNFLIQQRGGYQGIQIRYQGASSYTPAVMGSSVTIDATNLSSRVVNIYPRSDGNIHRSALTLERVRARGCGSELITIGEYVHGVTIKDVKSLDQKGGNSIIVIARNSSGHTVGDIEKIWGERVQLISISPDTDPAVIAKFGYDRHRRSGVDSIDGDVAPGSTLTIPRVTSSEYTLKSNDNGREIVYWGADDAVFTIPDEVSGNLLRDYEFTVIQGSEGKVTLAGGVGVVLLSASGNFQTMGAGSRVTVRSVNVNRFSISGDV